MGLCHFEHNPAFPLGYGESYGLKSKDGSVVYNGDKVFKGEALKVGEVVTVVAQISPPRLHPDPCQVNPGSQLYFFKGGRMVAKF